MTQLKKMSRKKANGIVFGKCVFHKLVCSPTNAEGHIAVFGGSGLGKTSALLIPTLQAWQGTSFTIDISGDICRNIDKPHKMIYEPANPDSIPYNIFGAIDDLDDVDEQNESLEQLALQLMPDKEKSNSDATEFFTQEGRKILTSAFIAFYHQGKDFVEICELIIRNGWKELFNMIDETNNFNAIQYINSFAGGNEKNTAGCKQAVDKVLKLFATNEKVKKTLRRPKKEESFTPKELESHNVFVIVEDSKLKLYSPLLRIITSQCMEFFSNRQNNKKPTILFSIDEFASFGRMEITEALRKLRKKGIRIMVLTQSMADIDMIYGRDERMSMMNNFRFCVILGITDNDTQEYFSKLIGHKEVTKYSKSKSANNVTTSESQSRERIIEAEALAHLGNKVVLLHPDGYILLKKNFYYK
ncbi:MAG: type IV secretory system conjugative DNA transfer family protein [Clostridiales bacterium]|nr:type IV secretory system conjugative DNA transfer family protein [Clostridiales bacterium]